MSAWIAGRGSTASGPLAAPPVPDGDRFRPWREEQVLARMLEAPAEVPALAAGLPPDTFTADVRYDIYAAILTLTSRGQRPGPEEVAVELGRRLAWLPDHALPSYGGPAGRSAQAYLSRLLMSPVTSGEAITAATSLHQEDAQCRALGLTRFPERAGDPGPGPRHAPEQATWQLLTGQAIPGSTVITAPVITQGPPPVGVAAAPVDPGLRPPQQPGPGGPVLQM